MIRRYVSYATENTSLEKLKEASTQGKNRRGDARMGGGFGDKE
jgi:hypothetical protein